MAFPGSMFGALLCGIIYWKTKKTLLTLVAEVFGTAILGGLCAYLIAILFMGKNVEKLDSIHIVFRSSFFVRAA